MIDLLKALVDLVVKALPAFKEGKRDKRFRHLGVELFLLCNTLNEALALGGEIVSWIEEYVSEVDNKLARGKSAARIFKPYAPELLAGNIHLQRRNLSHIGAALERSSFALQVLSPDAYRLWPRSSLTKPISSECS
jgi:hypothetical protein